MANKLTKLDKARIIVQALYNLDHLPAADHKDVRRYSNRSVNALEAHYQMAVRIVAYEARKRQGASRAELRAAETDFARLYDRR